MASSFKTWVLNKTGFSTLNNGNNLNYRTIEEEMLAQYSKTEESKRIKETVAFQFEYQEKLSDLNYLSKSVFNLNYLDELSAQYTISKVELSNSIANGDAGKATLKVKPVIGIANGAERIEEVSKAALKVKTAVDLKSQANDLKPVNNFDFLKAADDFHNEELDGSESDKRNNVSNSPSPFSMLSNNIKIQVEDEEPEIGLAEPAIDIDAGERRTQWLYGIDARERKKSFIKTGATSPREAKESAENISPLISHARERRASFLGRVQLPVSPMLSVHGNPSPGKSSSPISMLSAARDFDQLLKLGGNDPKEDLQFGFALRAHESQVDLKLSELIRIKSIASVKSSAEAESNQSSNSIATSSRWRGSNQAVACDITDDVSDEVNLQKAFNVIAHASAKSIRRIEMMSFLNAVISAYQAKGSELPFPSSIFRVRDISDSWFSVTNADDVEGMDFEAFKLLVNQISDILHYIRMVRMYEVEIDTEPNIWEEIISLDTNVIYDQKSQIQGATLGALIEKLTSAPIQEPVKPKKVFDVKDLNLHEKQQRRRTKSELPKPMMSQVMQIKLKTSDSSINLASATENSKGMGLKSRSIIMTNTPELMLQGTIFSENHALIEIRDIFFATYLEFGKAETLFKKLLERFNYPDHVEAIDGSRIQKYVVDLLVYWMKNHPEDFKQNLLLQVTEFIEAVSVVDLEAPGTPPETSELSDSQRELFSTYCNKMIHEIPMRDRKSKLNLYQHVFSGLDLAIWVLKHVPGHKAMRKVISFGQNVVELGLIEPIEKGSPFLPTKDSYYHFKSLKTDLKSQICLNLILSNQDFFNAFRVYSRTHGYEPHVNFLCLLEYFKDQNPEYQLIVARNIYDRFLSKTAKPRITNEDKLIRAVNSILRQNSVDVHLFDDIRDKVYHEVNDRCFAPFKGTRLFEDLIKALYVSDSLFMECPMTFNSEDTVCLLDYPESRVPDSFFQPQDGDAPVSPHDLPPGIEFKDVDELEIARQLTLASFEIFSKIRRSEFLDMAWTKTNEYLAPNLIDFIDRFNSESVFASLSILSNTKVKARARVMEKFIKIAWHCKQIRNFSSMVAIISSLSSASIGRLKYTKALLPKQATQMLAEMELFFNSSNNFKTYRDSLTFDAALDIKAQPTIPHMALYLQDLTFIADGNKKTVRGRLINFGQKSQVFQVIKQIAEMQRLPYRFFKVVQLWALLKSLPYATEKEMYKMSLGCEPKGADASQIV